MMTKHSMPHLLQKRSFFVYIIESPNPKDLYHKRFEGETLQKTLGLSGIESGHRLTVNKEAFVASFYVGLVEYFRHNTISPIIHISAHGDTEGIELTNEERVNWAELKDLLLPVNNVLNGDLILSLSSCRGSSGCRMSMFKGDHPFGAVIGSSGSPTWSETNIAYATFYHLFNKGVSISEAINGMKTASGNDTFMLIPSHTARQLYLETIQKEKAVRIMQQSIPKEQPESLNDALTRNDI